MTAAFRLGISAGSSTAATRSFPDRVRAVGFAAMAYWYYRWDWGESIALDGLDACAPLVAEPIFSTWVEREVDGWLATADDRPLSPMAPVGAALRRRDAVPGERRERIDAVLDRLVDRVRETSEHTGALTPERDGDLVFVDSLYGLPAALATIATRRDDDRLLREVAGWVDRHCAALQDPATGLFAHFSSLSDSTPHIAWGRGNGWAALGLADLLAVHGDGDMAGVADRLRQLLHGLLAFEVPGGGWRNLICEPGSYPETSTTAMVVAAIATATSVTHLDNAVVAAGERGWAAIADRIDAHGHVAGVSYRPGLNTDPARYEHTPAVGAYPWGQGAWLRAAAESTSPRG